MILVDSSVWIDYFRGRPTAQTDLLEGLLDSQELAIGDLIFTEVLQGCKFDKEFNEVRRLLGRLDLVVLGGEDVIVEAAKNYRKLRHLGLTVRGTIDVVLATRCIVSGHQLLHSDRDFDAFEQHLGLRCVGSAV
ncbi:PIN domain nuclease [Piscinibacter sp. HJYY11]|uniref:type II toxin-antitoxin system VapC family toxin n=1 Tax=Piscinibacter sp. HJYY11 TaxID=2801333 RepID=UPI00191D26A9|nr:PIN domain nuclease [Piscinibacter sp. HJYY11]MBL0731219.1 PIN domain nuclease [Piscinibacter sp. HJYY11]